MNLPNDNLANVEAMLRAAGGYVGPSDDLRPRVLEEVRLQRVAGVRRRRLTLAAAATLLLATMAGLGTLAVGRSVTDASASHRVAELAAQNEAEHAGIEGFYWSLVDAFLTVRQEQAEALGAEGGASTDAELP